MSEFDIFSTRDKSNEGVKVPLNLPDGSPSDHWLIIRNFRCDAYRDAIAAISARVAEQGKSDLAQARKDRLTLLTALVGGWSFETEFTPANVAKFLGDAQLVAEQIDRVAMDDARFFGLGSTVSTDGPQPS